MGPQEGLNAAHCALIPDPADARLPHGRDPALIGTHGSSGLRWCSSSLHFLSHLLPASI